MAEILVGAQVAASIISLSKYLNDLKKGRFWQRDIERYRRMKENVDNLGSKIILMVRDNQRLMGYKELHERIHVLLNYFDSLQRYIQNIYEDEGIPDKVTQHIRDANGTLSTKINPERDGIKHIIENQ